MIEISCDMCMDLMPLVQDGIASEDSRTAVLAHLEKCGDCRILFEGEIPQAPAKKNIVRALGNRLRLFGAMALMFGVLYGLSLTADSGLFLNAVIMPALGMLGYGLFRWRAAWLVPGILLGAHLLANTMYLFRGEELLDLASLLMFNLLYAIFAVVGVVVAGLLHFAFKKEN